MERYVASYGLHAVSLPRLAGELPADAQPLLAHYTSEAVLITDALNFRRSAVLRGFNAAKRLCQDLDPLPLEAQFFILYAPPVWVMKYALPDIYYAGFLSRIVLGAEEVKDLIQLSPDPNIIQETANFYAAVAGEMGADAFDDFMLLNFSGPQQALAGMEHVLRQALEREDVTMNDMPALLDARFIDLAASFLEAVRGSSNQTDRQLLGDLLVALDNDTPAPEWETNPASSPATVAAIERYRAHG